MKIANFGTEEWLNKWETLAIFDISQSSISPMTMNEALSLDGEDGEDFYKILNQKKMSYGWIEGSPDFKQEVSKLYKDIDPDNILQTNGAAGANHLALYALIEPGDHIISEYPSYQQLYDIPRGAHVDYWHIHENQNWYPDIDELKSLMRPDTKMICLNNANNPTGTLLDKTFLKQVVELAKQSDAYVLVDEVYLPLIHSENFVSIVDLYDKGIATNSLSKTYSMPGIRVGWTASNAAVTDLFRKYRDYTMICCGVFNDAMAVYTLKHRDQILNRNRKLVLNNLKIYKNWVASEPRISVVMPQAVPTSFPKLNIPIENTKTFCIRLLKEKGVLLVPGTCFNMPGHVRLGYCTDESTLKEGLKRLSAFMRQYD
ncbi:MAG: aminotransferase [Liquorilactobacillus ghanensis]|uniref:aminotransferase n=1 Tax=Liquorilactobacillus TaxID=2767888 RepID=UPI0039EBDA3E